MNAREQKAALSSFRLANQRIGFLRFAACANSQGVWPAGKSPVTASDEQRAGLLALANSRDRGEADRARAVLLTLAGWTSSKIAEAFGVREDTVRLWRSDFTAGGVAALKTSIAPGHLAHQTFTDVNALDQAIHDAVIDLNRERIPDPLAMPRISA